jgi:ferredoxin
VLTNLKRHPKPAEIAHSAFFATHDEDLCDGCELCLDRCQMEALSLDDGIIYVDRDRCIGCGLCITTCPNDALALQRKPESELRPLPRTNVETHLQLGKTRGVLNYRQIAGMFIRSKRDRVLARNDQ